MSFYIKETIELFTVSTDQSIEENYLNSDLLWVKETASRTTDAIPLTFTHKLAKINITLTSENSNADLSDATIYVCGTKIETNFNPLTGVLTDVTYANTEDIKAGVTTNGAATASAIIIPQTINADARFIKVVQGTKIYYYTMPSEKTFESGKSYSYTLKVKEKEKVILVSSKVTNWIDEGIEGSIDEKYSRLTVTLSSAGTLNEYLNASNKYDVSELKIIGDINAKDIQLIRDFAATHNYPKPNSETGALSILDLSEARIVSGGGTYTCEVGYAGIRDIETRDNVVTEGMFEYTNLKEVILPNTITEIAHSAFECMQSMTKFVVPEGVVTIGDQAFNTCYNFKSIILPESVETIGERAFDDCDGMKEITIPSKVTKLSNELFVRCNLLEKINLPEGITSIGNQTFDSCPNLKTIVIPKNVTQMGYRVFWGCEALKEIHCQATTPPVATSYSLSIFDNFTKSECTLYVPKGSLNAYKAATEWQGFKNYIEE